MAVSLDPSSPAHINKELGISMNSSPLLSPASESRFWSTLRSRVDTLLDNRKRDIGCGDSGSSNVDDNGNRLKEDCLLLLRGFDSVSASLSQLTSNIDTALEGARVLAKPSLTEAMNKNLDDLEVEELDDNGNKRGMKRKFEVSEISEAEKTGEGNEESLRNGKLTKAKSLAVAMANKAGWLARELKSIKSDLCFMQERSALLEEENRRLREGYEKGERPDEDDLVRLQLEALLTEKSRLATENANLIRENQCLRQLVEYHQFTAQDLSASYEEFIQGMQLDFSSPPPKIDEVKGRYGNIISDSEAPETPQTDFFSISNTLDEECRSKEQS
ncbi:hypothetical protein Sjap_007849 [Stephania japonica]|uniref:Uncharacterized protein n=1 Tax=Stephania japonica TaxID=461633 RepID=A0AAP0JP84_9MAGN